MVLRSKLIAVIEEELCLRVEDQFTDGEMYYHVVNHNRCLIPMDESLTDSVAATILFKLGLGPLPDIFPELEDMFNVISGLHQN